MQVKTSIVNQVQKLAYYIDKNILYLRQLYVYASNDLESNYFKTVNKFSEHIKETSDNIVSFFDNNQDRFFELNIHDSVVAVMIPVIENHQSTQNLFNRFRQAYKGSWKAVEDNGLVECLLTLTISLESSLTMLQNFENNLK